MTKASEQQASTGVRSQTKWDVYCPEEELNVIMLFPSKHAANQAAAEHNAQFTPAHTARAVVHTPSDEDPPHLTEAQREAFKENAAALEEAEDQLRTAQQKAYARLKEVGIDRSSDDVFETCLTCGCSAYVATPHRPSAACRREHCGHSLACHRW
ncbi:hypothetical protein OOK27_46205 [Streptomyces canus]|uniref:hypothetical protein n=1 Tax=Streptomyces canus TaxID=58343 RepID=UPI00224FCCC6|nr:hypothetical protein [Streptomyces canus]MCX5261459.1 hypothetical protein [Streptomyces canus]